MPSLTACEAVGASAKQMIDAARPEPTADNRAMYSHPTSFRCVEVSKESAETQDKCNAGGDVRSLSGDNGRMDLPADTGRTTGAGATMKADWLLRAEAEQEQLWSQLCRLEAALSNENFQLDEETRQDLKDQRAGMAQYNAALSRRIKRNGGTVCE